MATVITRTRIIVMLHVHCLSCYLYFKSLQIIDLLTIGLVTIHALKIETFTCIYFFVFKPSFKMLTRLRQPRKVRFNKTGIFDDRMTMHRNRFLVNKTNRYTEFQFYW